MSELSTTTLKPLQDDTIGWNTLVVHQGTPPPDYDRHQGIGSADIPPIMGTSRFKTARQIWNRKTGNDLTEHDNDQIRMGNYLEPAILDQWEKTTGLDIVSRGWCFQHIEHDWAHATPDGITADADGKALIVEAKNIQSEALIDRALPAYKDQVYWQMIVTGARQADIAFMCSLGWKFHIYRVNWDWYRCAKIWKAADQFWNHNVQKNHPPKVQGMDLSDLSKKPVSGGEKTADKDTQNLLNRLALIRQEKKELTTEEDELKARLYEWMGDSQYVVHEHGGTLAKVTTIETRRLNRKKIEADHPLSDDHFTTVTSRRLILMEGEDNVF